MIIELGGKMCPVISKINNSYYPVPFFQRPIHTTSNIKALTAGYTRELVSSRYQSTLIPSKI